MKITEKSRKTITGTAKSLPLSSILSTMIPSTLQLRTLQREHETELDKELTYVVIAIMCVIIILGLIFMCIRSYTLSEDGDEIDESDAINKQKKVGKSTILYQNSDQLKALQAKLLKEKQHYEAARLGAGGLTDEEASKSTGSSNQQQWTKDFKGITSKKALTMSLSQELSDNQRKGLRGGFVSSRGFKYNREEHIEQTKQVGSMLLQMRESKTMSGAKVGLGAGEGVEGADGGAKLDSIAEDGEGGVVTVGGLDVKRSASIGAVGKFGGAEVLSTGAFGPGEDDVVAYNMVDGAGVRLTTGTDLESRGSHIG